MAAVLAPWQAAAPGTCFCGRLLTSTVAARPRAHAGTGRGGATDDAISIPYDSTSYIMPVSTTKLFNDIRQYAREQAPRPVVFMVSTGSPTPAPGPGFA